MRKLGLCLLGSIVFAALMLSLQALAAVAKITDIRVSEPAGLTRLVFEISGAYRYQWKLQTGAKQLTLKLENTTLAANLSKSDFANTVIKDYQLSPPQKYPLQLMLQLATPVEAKVYSLPPADTHGNRLVIDLKPRTTEAVAKPAASPDVSAQIVSAKPALSSPVQKNTQVLAASSVDNAPQPAKTKPKMALADKSSRPIMVVIDPGHGGKDSGALGPAHTREKDVVLAISKLLQQSFNQEPGFQAQLTRATDIFIPLRQRLAIARKCRADIFIAIHADAAYNQDAIGASVFALSERGATSEGARLLAEKENESELLYGVTVNKDQMLRSVLLDLSQTHTIAVSLEMGREILHTLSSITKLHYARVEQAAFVVLKSPDIPSLLVETGYITNPNQEQKLRDPAYQRQLAAVIVQGVTAYFVQHPRSRRLITT